MALVPSTPTFLGLPLEIRSLIYSFTCPRNRLCKQKPLLRDLPGDRAGPRGAPQLFLVSKQIYEECARIFYSNAVLEIEPPRQISVYSLGFAADVKDAGNPIEILDAQFAFLPARFKKAIQTVDIYADFDGHFCDKAYEATLYWISTNLGLKNVHLSITYQHLPDLSLRQTQLFRFVDHLNMALSSTSETYHPLKTVGGIDLQLVRLVAAWPPFEQDHRDFLSELRTLMEVQRVPELQIYLYFGPGRKMPKIQADGVPHTRHYIDRERSHRAWHVGRHLELLAPDSIKRYRFNCIEPSASIGPADRWGQVVPIDAATMNRLASTMPEIWRKLPSPEA